MRGDKGGDVVSRGVKKLVPSFLGIVILIILEFLKSINGVYSSGVNIQTIGNILLLTLGIYSFRENLRKVKEPDRYIYCLDTIVIIVNGFILNIYIYHETIAKIADFFSGWHTIWSISFLAFLLWFTGIGKWLHSIITVIRNITLNFVKGVEQCGSWLTQGIENSHKGVLFMVVLGMFLWGITLIWQRKTSVEEIVETSLVFWFVWFIICIIIFSFIYIQPQIKQAIAVSKTISITKVIIWIILGIAVLLAIIKIFPTVLAMLGNILFIICIFILAGVAIYKEKDVFEKKLKMQWKDIVVVAGVFGLVTFVLIPAVGEATVDDKAALGVTFNDVDNLKTYMEFMKAGLELIRSLL